jgi:hypothetical protein
MLRAPVSLVFPLVLVVVLAELSCVAGERPMHRAAGSIGLVADVVTLDPPSAFEIDDDASAFAPGPALTR